MEEAGLDELSISIFCQNYDNWFEFMNEKRCYRLLSLAPVDCDFNE